MSIWTSILVGLLLFARDQAFALPNNNPHFPVAPSAQPDPSLHFNVEFNNQVFINKGLVGFGSIPSNARESTGDTLGGLGSAMAIKRGTWKKNHDGSYGGTLVVQPDRGFNVDNTIDYQARQHEIKFSFKPYYGIAPLSFTDSKKTLQLSYQSTLLYKDPRQIPTTGLDPLAIRRAQGFTNPPEPIADSSYARLSIDAEGLVLNKDGTFWMSDEYGPSVHLFSKQGERILSIQPPNAILPFHNTSLSKPVLNFTVSVEPNTGRVGNQGYEGLTANPSGTKLFAMLQGATVQDGGEGKATSRYTRLLAYDILPLKIPILVGEYVVPLPQKPSNLHTFAQSEVHYLSDTVFLVLARDGNGNGDGVGNEKSDYKSVDLIDISKATNIAHTKYDDPAHPVAPKGVLVAGIQPAVYQPFLNILNSTNLARLGLHNDVPIDPTLICGKWESIALAPVDDSEFPNDYFIFLGADNDFLTTDGVSVAQPYNAGSDVDSQFIVFRVTLPNVRRGSVEEQLGI